jgi:hypothetical protein
MSTPADDLLQQARTRLQELEEQAGDELGDRVELAVGEHFRGRYRGSLQMRNREGDVFAVLGLWGEDGRARFHYMNAALRLEMDTLAPLEVGAEVVLVRGEDKTFEKDGQMRTMHRYALAARPCSDPLPGSASQDDDDIPF